jgi:AAA domain
VAVLRSLTMLIYGASKAGKSTLAATAPYPRLMLDVEGGHRFLNVNVIYWNPYSEQPPVADGTWDTCVVIVNDYDTVLKAYEWLRSGQHQFKSLIIDSISELQVKLFDKLAGNEQVKMQQWGEVLRHMGNFMRNVRDLTTHPTAPLEAIILTAMARRDNKDGKYHPYLQGQLATVAPYLYDITGAVAIETFQHPDPMQPPYKVRRMYIEETDVYEAGERVQGRLGSIVEQDNLNVERMLDIVFGPRPSLVPPAPTE